MAIPGVPAAAAAGRAGSFSAEHRLSPEACLSLRLPLPGETNPAAVISPLAD